MKNQKKRFERINKKVKKNILSRFLKFSMSGSSTTLLDLFILGFLTEIIGVYYLISAIISFISSSSVNYIINIKWSFKDTKRRVIEGFLIFLIFACFGLAFTVLLLRIFVEKFDVYYLFARLMVAIIVGIINFILHSFFTFKVYRIFYKIC